MMNSLRNSRSVHSRLLPRKPTAMGPPPARYYYPSRGPPGNAASRPPPQVQNQWRERLPNFLRRITMVGGGAVAMYLSTREVVPYTNRTHFIIFPRKLERFIGELAFDIAKESSKVLPPHHRESVRVRRIASEIVRAVDLDRQRGRVLDAWRSRLWEGLGAAKPRRSSLLDGWEVIVVQDDQVNVECAPGGKIIVFTGFLDKFREDAEIATVLGHEIGHAIARHTAERCTKHVVRSILHITYRPALERASMSIPLLRRRLETEADHIGLLLLAAAGYDPRVAPPFYEKLGKIAGEDGTIHAPTVEAYHPSGTERVRILSQADVMNKALELYRGGRPCSNPL